MKTSRSFEPHLTRYNFDFERCSATKGFVQIDTKRDFRYYGMWCNPETRLVVTFAEGDVTEQICETNEEFVSLIREIETYHNTAGYGPTRIDALVDEVLAEQFTNLGLADLLH